MNQIGWVIPESSKSTHIVGQKEANAWGLYDMSGNVEERTWDVYGALYPSGDTKNPVVDPEGPPVEGTEKRVRRGGSWAVFADYARSATRMRFNPGSHFPFFGFRPVPDYQTFMLPLLQWASDGSDQSMSISTSNVGAGPRLKIYHISIDTKIQAQYTACCSPRDLFRGGQQGIDSRYFQK